MYGIVDLHKEGGVSSHHCVNELRKLLNIKRVGHSGTLDLEVEGVLNIYIGRESTKFIDLIKSDYKRYRATLELFKSSDTLDKWGEVFELEKKHISFEQFKNVVFDYVGEVVQLPPMYSALKYKGRPLYKYAREGIDIKRKERTIIVKNIEIIEFKDNKAILDIYCSKGTYVRTLIHDIGISLGTDAIMTNLIRTENDHVSIKNTYYVEDIKKMIENSDYSFVREMNDYLDMPKYVMNTNDYKLALNGNLKYIKNEYVSNKIQLIHNNIFVGVAEYNQDRNEYVIKRII